MSNGDHPETKRISVSQETLQLELENLELRLKNWLQEALNAKASAQTVAELSVLLSEGRQQGAENAKWISEHSIWADRKEAELLRAQAELAELKAGTFTDAFKRSIKELVGVEVDASESRKWTVREKWLGAVLTLSAISTFFLQVTGKWPG